MARAKNNTRLTMDNAECITHSVRYRENITEAEYRCTLSEMYDEMVDNASKKNLPTLSWALISNGLTHFISALFSDIPAWKNFTSAEITRAYLVISGGAFLLGGFLLLLSKSLPQCKSVSKRQIIDKYIEREFGREGSQTIEASYTAIPVDQSRKIA